MTDARRRAPDPVVTGIGAITPLAHDAPGTWQGLIAGRSGVGPIESFDASDLPTRIAGEVRGFDAEALLGPKRARRSARFSQLATVAAREAVADAGLDVAAVSDRTAVIVNSAVAGWPEVDRNQRLLLEHGPSHVSPYYIPSTIPNMAACEVAIDLGAHGPVNASALACASGTAALLEARRLLATGEADVVIAGGTDAGITRSMLAGLAVMGPLSQRNDDPEGQAGRLTPIATGSCSARARSCSWSSRPSVPRSAARDRMARSPAAR